MVKEKLYDYFETNYVDYSFDLCKQKNEFLELLKTSNPQKVKQFNSKGTKWYIGGDYGDTYRFFINGGQIFISTETESIYDFLRFFVCLAYFDNKDLLLAIEDEGSYSAISALALDNETIRFTRYDYGLMDNKKILFDIIINKRTFIKQIYEIFLKLQKDMKKLNNRGYVIGWLNEYLDGMKQYLDNPDKFKQNYDIEPHIRVFDIAYKDLDGNWQFLICFEDDERCEPEYWEKQKQEGKILDYDYLEQERTDGFGHKWKTGEKGSVIGVRLKGEELRLAIKPDMIERIEEKNWIYSPRNQKWYSTNEIMPNPTRNYGGCNNNLTYNIEVVKNYYEESEDEPLKSYIRDSYDKNGDLLSDEDSWGYLKCIISFKDSYSKVCQFEFDYRNNRPIRNALEIAQNGEYVRFNLGGFKYDKMHIWKVTYSNTEKTDVTVACYEETTTGHQDIERFYFTADKSFLDCFIKALDEIEYKIDVMKKIMNSAKNLKIDRKFLTGEKWDNNIIYLEPFVGDYACVQKSSLDGWGIINKNFEWVIKPEHVTVFGKEHPKWGKKIEGLFTKYTYLHNIDGKLFIAAKQDNKQFVMDIKGDIQIPHVSDKIYYTYLNNELWFVALDYDKTYIVNSKGEDVLTLDFPIGEKFWLLDKFIIVSKDNHYGLIDWKGRIKTDFIFTDINVNPNDLNYIAVKYIDKWGFVNKNGKVINMKIQEPSEADEKMLSGDLW